MTMCPTFKESKEDLWIKVRTKQKTHHGSVDSVSAA